MAVSTIKYDGDTSWTTIAFGSNSYVKYRRRSGILTIVGTFAGDVPVGDSSVNLLTLPEGYRPTEDMYFPVINRGTNGDGYGHVTSTGGVLSLRNSLTTMHYYVFCASFPVN